MTTKAIEILIGLDLNKTISRKKINSFTKNIILCEPMISKNKSYPTFGNSHCLKNLINIINYMILFFLK